MDIHPADKARSFVRRISEGIPLLPYRIREFVRKAKENPVEAAKHPAVWGTGGVIGAILVALFIGWLGGLFVPSVEGEAGEGVSSEQALFRVQCINRDCGHGWNITEKADYDNWPIRCPQCRQKTGHRLYRCPNPECNKWVVPTEGPDGHRICPACKQPIPAADD